MIKNNKIEIKVHTKNIKLYKENKIGDLITIDVSELPKGSSVKIDVICDNCLAEKRMSYFDYLQSTKDGKRQYYCIKCKHLHLNETLKNKYGEDVSNVMQLESVRNKHKESIKNIDYKEANNKRKITNKKLYNVEYVQQNKNIHTKTLEANKKKYGTEYVFLTKENRHKSIINSHTKESNELRNNKLRNKIADKLKLWNLELLNYNGDIYQIKCSKDHIFETNDTLLYSRNKHGNVQCTVCNPIGTVNQYENELCIFLQGLNIQFIRRDREILEGKELDIYIPSHNLAIEFNGLYWHSEIFRDKKYHLEKSLKCNDKGIQLLHIWEDEWVLKNNIVKSILLNKLGLIENRIYARKCEIKEVIETDIVKNFLNNNHIQGYSQSSNKLGLYYNNELVSLMTFGYRHTNSKKEYELIRFCNKLNTNVIGAASKLFKYFVSNYEFSQLISYSDFRLFDGKMYETLGFKYIHLSKPDYFWCKGLERKHRFNFNKRKLIKNGFDSNKTEKEIMEERGYYRIFGCGQYRWVYDK